MLVVSFKLRELNRGLQPGLQRHLYLVDDDGSEDVLVGLVPDLFLILHRQPLPDLSPTPLQGRRVLTSRIL